MSTNDADRRLTAWLTDVAPTREPDHLLDAVLEQTARTPRRPAWRIPERWIAMTTITTSAAGAGRVPWRLAVATVLTIIALVAGAILLAGSRQPKVPPPFGPAANGSFAYETSHGVEIRDVHGAVTTLDVQGYKPAFSRDGTQLAWMRSHGQTADNLDRVELLVGGPDGANPRSLGVFDGAEVPVWSPDGASIALESVVGGRPSLTMIDVRSGKGTVLNLGMAAQQPAFRPGGQQLVFRGQPDGGPWGLYLVGVDGTGAVHLALDPGFQGDASYSQADNAEYYFLEPAWSPDGSRLAFHTLEETSAPGDLDPGFRVHVAVVDAEGGVWKEVILPVEASIDDELSPRWLPDGSGLIVHRLEEGGNWIGRWPVTTALTTGSEQLLALPAGISNLNFEVAPDGKSVAAWDLDTGKSWLLPTDGAPATDAGLTMDYAASWQRTAP